MAPVEKLVYAHLTLPELCEELQGTLKLSALGGLGVLEVHVDSAKLRDVFGEVFRRKSKRLLEGIGFVARGRGRALGADSVRGVTDLVGTGTVEPVRNLEARFRLCF